MTYFVFLSASEMDYDLKQQQKRRKIKHTVTIIVGITILFALIIVIGIIFAFELPPRNRIVHAHSQGNIHNNTLRAIIAVNYVGQKIQKSKRTVTESKDSALEIIRILLLKHTDDDAQFALQYYSTPENTTLTEFCDALCTLLYLNKFDTLKYDMLNNPNQTDAILQYQRLYNATQYVIYVLFVADRSSYLDDKSYIEDMEKSSEVTNILLHDYSIITILPNSEAKKFFKKGTVLASESATEAADLINDKLMLYSQIVPVSIINGSEERETSRRITANFQGPSISGTSTTVTQLTPKDLDSNDYDLQVTTSAFAGNDEKDARINVVSTISKQDSYQTTTTTTGNAKLEGYQEIEKGDRALVSWTIRDSTSSPPMISETSVVDSNFQTTTIPLYLSRKTSRTSEITSAAKDDDNKVFGAFSAETTVPTTSHEYTLSKIVSEVRTLSDSTDSYNISSKIESISASDKDFISTSSSSTTPEVTNESAPSEVKLGVSKLLEKTKPNGDNEKKIFLETKAGSDDDYIDISVHFSSIATTELPFITADTSVDWIETAVLFRGSQESTKEANITPQEASESSSISGPVMQATSASSARVTEVTTVAASSLSTSQHDSVSSTVNTGSAISEKPLDVEINGRSPSTEIIWSTSPPSGSESNDSTVAKLNPLLISEDTSSFLGQHTTTTDRSPTTTKPINNQTANLDHDYRSEVIDHVAYDLEGFLSKSSSDSFKNKNYTTMLSSTIMVDSSKESSITEGEITMKNDGKNNVELTDVTSTETKIGEQTSMTTKYLLSAIDIIDASTTSIPDTLLTKNDVYNKQIGKTHLTAKTSIETPESVAHFATLSRDSESTTTLPGMVISSQSTSSQASILSSQSIGSTDTDSSAATVLLEFNVSLATTTIAEARRKQFFDPSHKYTLYDEVPDNSNNLTSGSAVSNDSELNYFSPRSADSAEFSATGFRIPDAEKIEKNIYSAEMPEIDPAEIVDVDLEKTNEFLQSALYPFKNRSVNYTYFRDAKIAQLDALQKKQEMTKKTVTKMVPPVAGATFIQPNLLFSTSTEKLGTITSTESRNVSTPKKESTDGLSQLEIPQLEDDDKHEENSGEKNSKTFMSSLSNSNFELPDTSGVISAQNIHVFDAGPTESVIEETIPHKIGPQKTAYWTASALQGRIADQLPVESAFAMDDVNAKRWQFSVIKPDKESAPDVANSEDKDNMFKFLSEHASHAVFSDREVMSRLKTSSENNGWVDPNSELKLKNSKSSEKMFLETVSTLRPAFIDAIFAEVNSNSTTPTLKFSDFSHNHDSIDNSHIMHTPTHDPEASDQQNAQMLLFDPGRYALTTDSSILRLKNNQVIQKEVQPSNMMHSTLSNDAMT